MQRPDYPRLTRLAAGFPESNDETALTHYAIESLRRGAHSSLAQILATSCHLPTIQRFSPQLLPNLTTPETELNRIRLILALDYQDSIETLNHYELLTPDNSYTPDYEYTNPEKPEQNFNRKEPYPMPTLAQIFENLSEEQLLLYKKMEEQGLKPRLQLTPIGLTLRKLKKQIDSHKELENQNNTTMWDDIQGHQLIYASKEFSVGRNSDGDDTLEKEGGISKAEWITRNDGWLVDIVATNQDFEADKKLQQDGNGRWLTLGQQAVNFHNQFQKEGYSHISYEAYMLAQMRAILEGKPLEEYSWTILLDSLTENEKLVSYGFWNRYHVGLCYSGANLRYNSGLRCRRSVRVLWNL
ncbi:hypothetical protein GF354_00600 [Candidatus Peregrinibacteria bacterium]|nr:hypothetical protein [Candidatus Peregrinibacteria bacterium]